MIKIVVHRYGNINEKFVEKVWGIINDCYERIRTHDVEVLDLYLFDKVSLMNAFLFKEKKEVGVKTSTIESSFFAVHDAWHGIPRIMVAYDKLSDIPELVIKCCLIHEVAHTILHGSLEFYSFSIPVLLLELENERIISKQGALDLLYLVAIAVKDYEVSRLLYKHGFVEEQIAYCRFFLKPSQEDYEAWELAKENSFSRLLVLTSILKTLCFVTPLLKDKQHDKEIATSIAKSMNYLPPEYRAQLLKLLKVCSKFGEDTHNNVDLFTRKIVEELVVKT